MNYKKLLFLQALALLLPSSYSLSSTTTYGSVVAQHKTYESLTVYGSADLESVKIADKLHVYGSCHAQHITASQVKVKGSATLQDVQVFQDLDVSGSCDLERAKAHNLTVAGSLQADKIAVEKNATLSGSVDSKDSEFESLIISSNDAKFHQCMISGDIQCRPFSKHRSVFDSVIAKIKGFFGFNSNNQLQVLLLSDTTVCGDIVFEQPGMVKLQGSSQVKGQVIGAQIKQA